MGSEDKRSRIIKSLKVGDEVIIVVVALHNVIITLFNQMVEQLILIHQGLISLGKIR